MRTRNKLLAVSHNTIKPKHLILTERAIGDKAKSVLLKFGLKCTPTPRSNHTELKSDVTKVCRKLRFIEYSANKMNPTINNGQDPSLVRNASKFNPPAHRDVFVNKYIDFLTKYPLEEATQNAKRVKNNLKKDELSAITQLKQNKNLIIKEGDKGGACVIMDK